MPDDDRPSDEPANAALTSAALRAAMPLFIPAIPFGLVLGVAISESAMPTAVAWSTNLASSPERHSSPR
jgi:predicted branched-subunit amino acid permease